MAVTEVKLPTGKIELTVAKETNAEMREQFARMMHDLGMDKQLPKQRLTADQQASLDELRRLGGAGTHEEDIVHEGARFVLPANLTTEQALHTLRQKVE